jgi:RsiW-degrading membrane proteinase PrsW (M82 family)
LDVLTNPGFYMTYAVLQAALVLLVIRSLDLYERESIGAVALMALWGATGAAFIAAIGNQVVLGALSGDLETVFGTAISAPVVEELAKGVALVTAFAISVWAGKRLGRQYFDGPTDGIVYGAAIGLGFAFTEDFFYFVIRAHEQGPQAGFETFLDRRDFFGPAMLHHPLFTAAFGAGLGLATWTTSRLNQVVFPLVGLVLAVLMHAVNNGFAELALVLRYGLGTTADWLSGAQVAQAAELDSRYHMALIAMRLLDYFYVAAFLVGIALWLRFQRRVIQRELAEESWLGGRPEVANLTRFWRRSTESLRLLARGELEQWQRTKQVHRELTDLAFLKWRVRRLGGDEARVRRRRRRIRNILAPETTQELQAVGIYETVEREKGT